MTRAGASLIRSWARAAWSASARQPRRWCTATAVGVLGAFAVFGSGSTVPRIATPLMPGATAPVDRTTVAMPPVYPAPPPGFLRLPDTRLAPIAPPAAAVSVNGVVVPGVQANTLLPGQGPVLRPFAADRPVWTPARLEPVVGLDANGRVTSILEYTPGRFEH